MLSASSCETHSKSYRFVSFSRYTSTRTIFGCFLLTLTPTIDDMWMLVTLPVAGPDSSKVEGRICRNSGVMTSVRGCEPEKLSGSFRWTLYLRPGIVEFARFISDAVVCKGCCCAALGCSTPKPFLRLPSLVVGGVLGTNSSGAFGLFELGDPDNPKPKSPTAPKRLLTRSRCRLEPSASIVRSEGATVCVPRTFSTYRALSRRRRAHAMSKISAMYVSEVVGTGSSVVWKD